MPDDVKITSQEAFDLTEEGYTAVAKQLSPIVEAALKESELSEANGKLEQIKSIIEIANGWPDGETFYKSAIEEIREVLAPDGE